jgi:hypothetical protein
MADLNKNPDSKQADGNTSDRFKTKPTDKESGSMGGQKASGGTDSSSGTSGSKPGYAAGHKDDKAKDSQHVSGESGSGKSGSTNR